MNEICVACRTCGIQGGTPFIIDGQCMTCREIERQDMKHLDMLAHCIRKNVEEYRRYAVNGSLAAYAIMVAYEKQLVAIEVRQ